MKKEKIKVLYSIHRHYINPEYLKKIVEIETKKGFEMIEFTSRPCGNCGMMEVNFIKGTYDRPNTRQIYNTGKNK